MEGDEARPVMTSHHAHGPQVEDSCDMTEGWPRTDPGFFDYAAAHILSRTIRGSKLPLAFHARGSARWSGRTISAFSSLVSCAFMHFMKYSVLLVFPCRSLLAPLFHVLVLHAHLCLTLIA